MIEALTRQRVGRQFNASSTLRNTAKYYHRIKPVQRSHLSNLHHEFLSMDKPKPGRAHLHLHPNYSSRVAASSNVKRQWVKLSAKEPHDYSESRNLFRKDMFSDSVSRKDSDLGLPRDAQGAGQKQSELPKTPALSDLSAVVNAEAGRILLKRAKSRIDTVQRKETAPVRLGITTKRPIITGNDDRYMDHQRAAWQIQKKGLLEKFGPAGWSPRKRLSPDTLEGIRALHAQYPDKYTTPMLADQFKVSPEAIRRILKSKWRPNEEEEEKRRERWGRRGENIWSQMVEIGIKPPKKWRAMGMANFRGRSPKVGEQLEPPSRTDPRKTSGLERSNIDDLHTTPAVSFDAGGRYLLADRIV